MGDKVTEAIALGIGPQTDQATINEFALAANDLITGPAESGSLTGILLRSPEDLSKAFERIESDGGRVTGSLTRESGDFIREEPTVSFTIDLMGSHATAGNPLAIADFTFDEYFSQILGGIRLQQGTETDSETPYAFTNTTDGDTYKTLKIWRGIESGGGAESWTLIGCTFNLTFDHVAGEKSTVTVDVIADSVEYSGSATFPDTNSLTVSYGNQRLAAPICERALSTLDGTARSFQSASLSIAYDVIETPDCNVITGLIKSQGTRSIEFTADYFRDDGEDDFDFLSDELAATGPPQIPVSYTIGQLAVVDGLVNAVKFDIASLRVTSTDKVDGEQVLRTISGYATISGDSGAGSLVDGELVVSGV